MAADKDFVVRNGIQASNGTFVYSNGKLTLGNSTVNAIVNTSMFALGNTTANVVITPTLIRLGAGGRFEVGNATVNVAINSSGFWVNGDVLSTAPKVQTLTVAANITWNVANGQIAKVLLNANNCNIDTPTGLSNGTFILIVQQDGTGGRVYTMSNTIIEFPGGIKPPQSTGVNQKDVYSFVYDGSKAMGSYMNDLKGAPS